jgi:hypothetical protein
MLTILAEAGKESIGLLLRNYVVCGEAVYGIARERSGWAGIKH